jgi:hypothetical protein
MHSRGIIRVQNATCMGEMRVAYKVLARKSEETTPKTKA